MTRRASGVLTLLLLSFATGLATAAAPLVAVLSNHQNGPHRQVAEAFSGFLATQDPGVRIRNFSLADKERHLNTTLQEVDEAEPDLIFTLGSRAASVAARRFPRTPLLASMVLTPVQVRQAAGATAVTLSFSVETQLRWLARLLPGLTRIGVLFDPEENQQLVDSGARIAPELGLQLIPIPVATPKELPGALNRLSRRADVLWAIPDKTVYAPQTVKQVLVSSFRDRIPVAGLSEAWAKAGAIYALDRDYDDLGKQSGAVALEILRGTPADKIAPAAPRKVVYGLNLKTAHHMKVEFPPDIIQGAAVVFR